jgi:Protein of unknown function (DUF402)
MTEASRDDQAVTDSGGTMVRLTRPPRAVQPDLALLQPLRQSSYADPVRPAGDPPYFDAGAVISWHYGDWADVLRVIRDDQRGLVAWLPSGSERVVAVAADGRGLRDRPVAERPHVQRVLQMATWRGPGIVKIAPTGVPWSVWYFTDDSGTFEGHYVNLELAHERPVDQSPRVLSRDLVLDVWVEGGDTWLKDTDELEAAVAAGKFTAEQGDVIRAVAEQARFEMIQPRGGPLDEGWESWRPPEGWDEPLSLPASLALPS